MNGHSGSSPGPAGPCDPAGPVAPAGPAGPWVRDLARPAVPALPPRPGDRRAPAHPADRPPRRLQAVRDRLAVRPVLSCRARPPAPGSPGGPAGPVAPGGPAGPGAPGRTRRSRRTGLARRSRGSLDADRSAVEPPAAELVLHMFAAVAVGAGRRKKGIVLAQGSSALSGRAQPADDQAVRAGRAVVVGFERRGRYQRNQRRLAADPQRLAIRVGRRQHETERPGLGGNRQSRRRVDRQPGAVRGKGDTRVQRDRIARERRAQPPGDAPQAHRAAQVEDRLPQAVLQVRHVLGRYPKAVNKDGAGVVGHRRPSVSRLSPDRSRRMSPSSPRARSR